MITQNNGKALEMGYFNTGCVSLMRNFLGLVSESEAPERKHPVNKSAALDADDDFNQYKFLTTLSNALYIPTIVRFSERIAQNLSQAEKTYEDTMQYLKQRNFLLETYMPGTLGFVTLSATYDLLAYGEIADAGIVIDLIETIEDVISSRAGILNVYDHAACSLKVMHKENILSENKSERMEFVEAAIRAGGDKYADKIFLYLSSILRRHANGIDSSQFEILMKTAISYVEEYFRRVPRELLDNPFHLTQKDLMDTALSAIVEAKVSDPRWLLDDVIFSLKRKTNECKNIFHSQGYSAGYKKKKLGGLEGYRGIKDKNFL